MCAKKLVPLTRGVSAVMASVFVLSAVGTGITETWRSALDYFLNTKSYETVTDEDAARFKTDYATIGDMAAAARSISVREGEEGTVVMKNDNNVLPLQTGKEVALFGLAAYAPYPYAAGDLRGGNDDQLDLAASLKNNGIKINSTIEEFYTKKILNQHEIEVANMWTGEITKSIGYDNIYVTSPGDFVDYKINEVPVSAFESLGVPSDWKSSVNKNNTVGICVFARGAGEGNTYAPGSAIDYAGNKTGKDPLALSDDELSIVDVARETCSQVIVLLNTGNTMMIGDIAEGGTHEVDGICYIGVINDYQCEGIANVLTGKVNATGALADTFVKDFNSIPAVQNFGKGMYADYEIVASKGTDARYPGEEIANTPASSFGGAATYNGGTYIVEAEGIYVGYKYYETRYFDSIVNPSFNALVRNGSTQGGSWDYDKEVLYTFGHGLSYLDYEQNIKSINVEKTTEGNVTAVVTVTNKSNKDGKFLTQLYVQQPYTQYDRTNSIEKSAVTFLNSAKVDLKAGESKDVVITVPSKYLASYDYKNAKTYILDDGDYYFTAAAGAHEAANNFLAKLGKKADGGAVAVWNLDSFDKTTFSVQNGTVVTNVADDADLNYWTGENTVTYLTRQDWTTFPVNYNNIEIFIGKSAKKDEWIKHLRNQIYDIKKNNPAAEAQSFGLKFNSEDIQYAQLSDIGDEYWDKLVAQISIDEAVGAVLHGGSRSDVLTNVENPIVLQNEGVSGFTTPYVDESTGKKYHFNIHSQTLMGTSFNPELAYEWGLVEGNSGLWINRYDLWGTGLTQRRTPYNGRNYEYISEDPMLTNRIGAGILQGCADKGIINGPKHMGFNDQEHNRGGISAYMNEQKFRETDLRGFEGALCDADGLAVMIAFNRIGATNAAMHTGMIQDIVRGEWGYTGLISTDMMNNKYYFNGEAMVMAGITQVADFATDDNHLNQGENGMDKTWGYLSVDGVKNDSEFVEMARENLKYQLYTFANSAVLNVETVKVDTWWDVALRATKTISMVLMICSCCAFAVLSVLPGKKED